MSYIKQVSNAYNKKVRPWTFTVSDIVLKAAGHVQKRLSVSKFAPKWEGPYVIHEAYNSGNVFILGPILMNS